MIAIVCIDDNKGMLFNKRRQSRDKRLIEDVLKMAGEKKIWIHKFSAGLFEKAGKNVMIEEGFLMKAGRGEFCFVENVSLMPIADNIEEIVVYKWNRKYPADFYFDLDLSEWELAESEEFAGSSHEKIGKERYKRGN